MRVGWLTVLALVSAADGDVAPPLRLEVHATPNAPQLGEVFSVDVSITHAPDQRYELRTPTETGDFEFVGSERARVDSGASSTTTFAVKFQGFTLGAQKTPELHFDVSHGAVTSTLSVPGADVDLTSSLPPDAQSQGASLRDIRPPMDVPERTWRLVWGLLGALAAAAVGWWLWTYLRRSKATPAVPAVPPEPLSVRTMKALNALAKENLPAQHRQKEFYFRLSEIVRGYLGELYHFDALESTTPELLDALRGRNTPGLPFQALVDFAQQSDVARYAKAEVTADACKESLDVAYRIVRDTTGAAVAATPAKPPHAA